MWGPWSSILSCAVHLTPFCPSSCVTHCLTFPPSQTLPSCLLESSLSFHGWFNAVYFQPLLWKSSFLLALIEIQLSTKTSASPAALSFEAVPSHTSVLGGGSTFSLIVLPTFKHTAPLPSYKIPTPSQLMPSCHTPLYYLCLHAT